MGTSAIRLSASLVLCLAGAALSAVLLLQHHGEPRVSAAVEQVCGEAGTSGCDAVARSSYSAFAGRPVAAWGLLFYSSLALLLALALLASSEMRDTLAGAAFAGLALGLLVDLLLLGVQAVAIKAFCTLCLVTYALTAGALVALWPARRGALGLGAALDRAEGRLALVGWSLGTLALTAAVLAGEVTLDLREAQRQARLLGAPAPAPIPVPPPPAVTPVPTAIPTEASPSSEPDVKDWQAQAKRLQETLDDPRKLEQYFSDKARREFEVAPVVTIDLENVPARGPTNAPVKVVEYSDFLCPFCRNLAGALVQFIPQAGGRVAVYFKNYPLDKECNSRLPSSTHPGACRLALGAICAQYQGKFEAYHDRVFAEELRNPQPSDVVRLAGEAGLNAAAVDGCLSDPRTKEALAAQIAEGDRLGVRSTPTVFINGKKLPRINDFVPLIDKEAQRKGFAPLGR